jgi:hypothetical protein
MKARASFLVLSILACLAFAAPASALVLVGQTKPDVPFIGLPCGDEGIWDEFQTAVSSGPSYTAPSSGVLTSWSTKAGPETGQKYELKVYRVSGSSYTVIGHDVQSLTASTLNTFPTSIPVQAGDIIGTHVFGEGESSSTICVFKTGLTADKFSFKPTDALDGVPTEFNEHFEGYRLNISATLLPPPTIAGLTPPAGSVTGGSGVTIAGTNFAQVSSVSFGSAPATFTVDSEGQITAKAPPSKVVRAVPVTVTSSAGSATSATTFVYEGCKVPKLGGKKLKLAKKALKKANCKLGKVTKKDGATAKRGKVGSQSPKPGKILAPAAKVRLTLRP